MNAESEDDVYCLYNDGLSTEWDDQVCVVNSILNNVSLQVLCDCQLEGVVQVASDLSATDEEGSLLETQNSLDQELYMANPDVY